MYSVGRIRGARQADDADWHVICLIVSIDLSLHCIGDYERVWEGGVTAVCQGAASWELEEGAVRLKALAEVRRIAAIPVRRNAALICG